MEADCSAICGTLQCDIYFLVEKVLVCYSLSFCRHCMYLYCTGNTDICSDDETNETGQPLALLGDEFMQVKHGAAATRIASDSMIVEGLSAMNISE
jgi:hypothetical protein